MTARERQAAVAHATEAGRETVLRIAERVRESARRHPRLYADRAERQASQWMQVIGTLHHWAAPGSGYSDAELAAYVRALVTALDDPAASVDPTDDPTGGDPQPGGDR